MYFLQLIFNLLCIYRDELGQKAGVSSGNAKAGHTDMDGSLFHNGTKADGKNTLSALIFTFCFRRNSAFWDFMNKFKCKASLNFNCVFARPITHYLYYENDMQIFQRCLVICKWLLRYWQKVFCFQTLIQTVSYPWTNTAARTHPLIRLTVKMKILKWNQNGIMRDSHYTALQKVRDKFFSF